MARPSEVRGQPSVGLRVARTWCLCRWDSGSHSVAPELLGLRVTPVADTGTLGPPGVIKSGESEFCACLPGQAMWPGGDWCRVALKLCGAEAQGQVFLFAGACPCRLSLPGHPLSGGSRLVLMGACV